MQYNIKAHELYVSQKNRLIAWFDSHPEAYTIFRNKWLKNDIDDYLKENCSIEAPLRLAHEFRHMGCNLSDTFSKENLS